MRLNMLKASKELVIELARDCAEDDRGAAGDHRAYARKLACDNFWMSVEMENVFVDEYARAMAR